jgi:hypothetical protein
MPKTRKKAKGRAKKEPAPAKKSKKDPYIFDDQGEKVWISTVTVADMKRAAKTGQTPNKNRRELVRIPSKQTREGIYAEAAQAIANKEQASMALYGGRPWTVTARITEPKGGGKPPLFRWFRGYLELAVLPHLLEKIPEAPKLKGNQEYTEEDEYIPSTCLEERAVSSLSWVAWEDREYAIPNVTVKWLSPDHVYFYSRKSAWEHQNKLAEQQIFLNRMIYGLGHRGQKLAPFKPSKKDAMQAGKWRFLRDGLWVVGQEEAWQEERAEWWQEELERKTVLQAAVEKEKAEKQAARKEKESKPPAGKRMSALAYYLHLERRRYRDEKVKELKLLRGDSAEPIAMTLREAETELRDVWKTLSTEERNMWKQRAENAKDSEAAPSNETVKAEAKDVTTAPMEKLSPILLESDSATVAGVSLENGTVSDAACLAASVSPSPPLVPCKNGDANPGLPNNTSSISGSKTLCESDRALLPDTGVSTEGAKDPPSEASATLRSTALPTEHHSKRQTEHHASTSLVPGSQVLSESEASPSQYVAEAKSSILPGSKVLSESEALLTVSVDTEADPPKRTEISSSSGVSLERASHALTSKPDSNQKSSEIVGSNAGRSAPLPCNQTDMTTLSVMNKAEPDDEKQAVVFANQKPVTLSSAKKCRKSASRAPKKITPSTQFFMTCDQIELCYAAVSNHFEKVMNTVKARALHSELQDGFDLLRERGRGRYDMELPVFDHPEFDFLTNLQGAAWMPIVREILGDDVVLIHKGAFLSMPGAEPQEYHQDGPHLSTQTQRPCHAVNVFIPLVDLHMRNGPTEFCLGTQVLGHECFVKDRVETPCVTAGTPIIFDYRLGHRGLGNSSQATRPVVYCTYAAAANGKEFRDSVNFSRRRYHKIGELVDKPMSREERANERAAKRRKHSEEAALAEFKKATAKEPSTPAAPPVQSSDAESNGPTNQQITVHASPQHESGFAPPSLYALVAPPSHRQNVESLDNLQNGSRLPSSNLLPASHSSNRIEQFLASHFAQAGSYHPGAQQMDPLQVLALHRLLQQQQHSRPSCYESNTDELNTDE